MAEPARLAAALAGWQQWSPSPPARPQPLAELTGGRVNQSFLVGCGDYRAVVRLNNPRSAALGIDRASERAVIATLAAKPYTADCYYCDAETLVSEYIDGQPWSSHQWQSCTEQRRLAAVVADYAAQTALAGVRRYHYGAYCAGYINQLPAQQLGGWRHLLTLAASVDQQLAERPRQLVHHDLTAANVIESKRGLVVLDWEYAGLSAGAIDSLGWLPAAADSDWQRQLRELTDQLCALWAAVAEQ